MQNLHSAGKRHRAKQLFIPWDARPEHSAIDLRRKLKKTVAKKM